MPYTTCGVGSVAVGAKDTIPGVGGVGAAVVGGIPSTSTDDYLPYSYHRKAPYLVWDDERSGGCRRRVTARSRRAWVRTSGRCCPWPCVLLLALASAVLFGSLVALCAYLSGQSALIFSHALFIFLSFILSRAFLK